MIALFLSLSLAAGGIGFFVALSAVYLAAAAAVAAVFLRRPEAGGSLR